MFISRGAAASMALLAAGLNTSIRPTTLLAQVAPRVTTQKTGVTGTLFAVSAVNDKTVWASGSGGVVLRTLDGGTTWERKAVPGAERLQFRDVHALNADSAWILSIGNGDASRIYFTADGGTNWKLQFQNADTSAFFDCITMLDNKRGVVFGDASQDRTMILRTDNGGASWGLLPQANVPPPVKGEGAYAASGRCIVHSGDKNVWIATGGPESRLFRSTDAGVHWTLHTTPFMRSASGGTSGIDFRDTKRGIGVAGDMGNLRGDTASAVVAVTNDGGLSWELRTRPGRPGALYGVTWVPGVGNETAVAAGTGGVFYTSDAGRTWATASELAHAGLDAHGRTAWIGGARGSVLRIDW
ncbi:MAG: oxidoreductase [Phycisphaerae bacterium]|nr:oxidoreductase [Gemmatimonadaceae bacterium]